MKEVATVCESDVPGVETSVRATSVWAWVRRLLLLSSVALYALHFVHLRADFPHDSPWNDWAKYTDEGWYGDAAIRHFVLGHWYLAGDFNPAVAMPVWPLLVAAVFAVTGVSLAAARALAVVVFGGMLLALYALLRQRVATGERGRVQWAAPIAVLLACANPFLFAFDRLAIAEPLVAALGVPALFLAGSLRPWWGQNNRWERNRHLGAAAGLGVILASLALSKPTAVALLPAILYVLWRVAGCQWGAALRIAVAPLAVGATLLAAYYALLWRFGLLADYRYLFDANTYTSFRSDPFSWVVRMTLWNGRFVGGWMFALFVLGMGAMALWRRRFFREPLAGALLLWAGTYLLLLGYHNNPQPRYYLLLAIPVIALLAMALEEALAWAAGESVLWRCVAISAVAVCVGSIAVPGIWQEGEYLAHPDYSYLAAARGVATIVRADRRQSPWVLSVSGSELTLMTGLPSINDEFGTLDLDERARQYRPGWYAAWNEMDDDKMDALREFYRPVRVAAFPAMDDPGRNLLILYRLDPAGKSLGQAR